MTSVEFFSGETLMNYLGLEVSSGFVNCYRLFKYKSVNLVDTGLFIFSLLK